MRLPVVLVAFSLTFFSACACDDRGTQLGPRLVLEGAAPDESGAADWKVDFGAVLVQGKATPPLHFRNAGTAPLKLRLAAAVDPPFGSGIASGGLTVEVGGTAPAPFSFEPREAGRFEAVVEIRSNEAGKERRKLRLVGVARLPDLRCSPELLDFGMVLQGQEASLRLRCRNELDIPLAVQPATFRGAAQFFEAVPGEGSDGPLLPGAELELAVRYRAQVLGSFSAHLHLEEAGELPLATVPIRAEAVSGDLQVRPGSCLDFGTVEVGEASARTLRVHNVSAAPRTVEALETQGDVSVFSLLAPALPFTVPPKGEVELTLEYRPTFRGKDEDLLSFVFDSEGERKRASACVQGWAEQARLACSPVRLDFGDVAVGSRSALLAHCQVGEWDEAQGPLVVTELLVEGAFEARILHADGSVGPRSEGYAPGARFFLEAAFSPEAEGLFAGGIELHAEGAPAPISIELLGVARALPPCVFDLRPPSLRFGHVPVGERRTLHFTVLNEFEHGCLLNGLRLEPGSDPAFEMEEVASVEIPAREQRSFPVHFAPGQAGRASGAALFTISDPAAPPQRVELSGSGGSTCLQVDPVEVDFGEVPPACSTRHQEVSVANLCNEAVSFESISIDELASPWFRITLAPHAPFELPPGHRAEVLVAYLPDAMGAHQGALVFERRNDEPLVVPLRGQGSPVVERTDAFTQVGAGNRKVDVLWVIDNSGSMTHRQGAIRERMEPFLAFALEQKIDFQVGVTTTGLEPYPPPYGSSCPGGVEGGEAGRLFPVDHSSPRILHRGMPFSELEKAWKANTGVGTCHVWEYPFEAAKRALSPPLINNASVPGTPERNDGNLGFLRPDAALSIIVVHDQANELESHTPVEDFVAFFKGLKPPRKQDQVKVHTISGPASGSSCAMNCPRCVAAAELSGGLWLDICSQSPEAWTETMRRISEAAFGVEMRIDLSAQPADRNGDWLIDDKDIELRVDGKVRSSRTPSGRVWWYDSATNSIHFEATHLPEDGQEITVTYQIACA